MTSSTTQPQVAAIILTFNDDTIVLKCIETLLASDYANLIIYLIDNGSSWNIAEQLGQRYPGIKCIRSDRNLGYAGGLNYAMKHVYRAHPDLVFFWLFNNDVSVEPDTLTKLIRVAAGNPKIGFIGPESFKRDGSGRHDNWITKRHSRNNPARIYMDDDMDTTGRKVVEVEFVSGHCLLIRTEVVREIGMMRPDFFIYWEEAEWQWRAKHHSWLACVVPGSLVYHDRLSFDKPGNLYLRTRNLLFFNRLILREEEGFATAFVSNVVNLFYLGLRFAARKFKPSFAAAFLRGAAHGMVRPIPPIEGLVD